KHAIEVGVVIGDNHGHLVKGLTGFERAAFSPRIIEAFVVREALSWLKSWHLGHAIIMLDCMSVVHALTQPIVDDSEFGCLISDCLVLCSLFQHYLFVGFIWLI
ncbi:hypothetical protein Goari_019253, partial [Gossypium aridum]|nr:hypothetical protein [Gossypium aridum]